MQGQWRGGHARWEGGSVRGRISAGVPHGCVGLPRPRPPHAVGSSDSPSCTEEEQKDSLNAQRQFEPRQPVFFISGKCRQGNFPCWKSDFPFDPAASLTQHWRQLLRVLCLRHLREAMGRGSSLMASPVCASWATS